MANCSCDVLLGNAALPGCIPSHGVIRKIIRVPLYDNDGNRNRIDLTATLDSAFWSALENNADTSKRYYPTPKFKTVTQERADALTEDFDDGSTAFIRDGIKTFNGFIVKGANPQLQGRLSDDRCSDSGVLLVDDCDNLIGSQPGDGFLYPQPIDNESWNPQFIEPTDTTKPKVNLAFNFTSLFKDANIGVIPASDIGISLLNDFNGLKDVNFTIVSKEPTFDGMVVNLEYIYGYATQKLPITGVLPAEFILNNNDTPAVVAVVTAPESPDGTYALTYAPQAGGESFTLSVLKNTLAPESSITDTF